MIENLVRTVLGAGLLYLILCLVVSGINVVIAEARGSQGKFLKMGIRGMLPDTPLFRRVMQHPLISGMYRTELSLGKAPSYLSSTSFASAVVEVVRSRASVAKWTPKGESKVADLRSAAETLRPDHPIVAQSLLTIIERSDDSYDRVFAGIEAWYETSMERVRTWYARFTRRRLLTIAFVLAILFNIDAFHVVRSFWMDGREEPIVAGLTIAGPATDTTTDLPQKRVEELARVEWPIGYVCFSRSVGDFGRRASNCGAMAWKSFTSWQGLFQLIGSLLGWIATAIAVALGAPGIYRTLSRASPR